MSQALYRKYRSRSFDEIVGQSGVVTALKNAVKSGDIGHAYLFTGPRGVGKTSIARIFAYAINNTPYNSEELPIDIIEIDAASNRGIDEVRDLREKVRIAPVVGPYKIYIIDEVHMLTSHAFNALLKTLEEPPAHAVFILATTEGHRLPETITSRTQRYNFRLATTDQVAQHLKDIAIKENITIDDDALYLIANHSGGSLRDALSMLDHARHLSDTVTGSDIEENIGIPSGKLVESLFNAVLQSDAKNIIQTLSLAEKRNVSSVLLATSLMQYISQEIQQGKTSIPIDRMAQLLGDLVEVESSNQPSVKLQIALLKACATGTSANPQASVVQSKVSQAVPVAKQVTKNTTSAKKNDTTDTMSQSNHIQEKPIPAQHDQKVVEPAAAGKAFTQQSWMELLESLRASHNTLYSVLRMAELDGDVSGNDALTLYFAFPFHLKRISESKNKTIIQNRLAELGYGNIELQCELRKNSNENDQSESIARNVDNNTDDVVSKIRGVFGAAEVLE